MDACWILEPGLLALVVGLGSQMQSQKDIVNLHLYHTTYGCAILLALTSFIPNTIMLIIVIAPMAIFPIHIRYIFFYGCHCECVLQSDYPDYDPDCYPCLDCSACCTIFHCSTKNEKFPLRNSTTHPVLMSNHHLHNILLLMPYNNSKLWNKSHSSKL